jgi:ribonucleoside-diphosphate reductase subunit M1
MKVIKRNGLSCEVEFDEITKKIKSLADKSPKLDIDPIKIAKEVITLIYDGITTSELDEFTANISASMSIKNLDYEELASRLIINNHIKNTDDSFVISMNKIKNLLSEKFLDTVNTYSSILEDMIVKERDYLISYFGFCTLYKSYLLKDINNSVIERPQYLFLRVAIGIHQTDLLKVKETYDLLSQKYFTHATPTLFNAGTKYPQMSSCFLIGTDDSVEGIYKTISDTALISKWAGGVGIHISNIRAEGSKISKTNGDSRGIMPMLKVYNDTARYINQSGKRNGSFAMYIEPWHADIFTFLEAKKNNGAEELRARDLFYALWIPNIFMERVKNKGKWSLMCPSECPGLTDTYGKEFEELYIKYEEEGRYKKQIEILDLWNFIINSQIETGTPYMLYKDSINEKSNQKNIGIIKSSNLCTEICEYSDNKETAVCNLASICLPTFLEEKKFDDIFIVYSKTNCKFCTLAKNVLNKLNIQYREIIGSEADRLNLYEQISTDDVIYNTMPQIFYKSEHIGGYIDLLKYISPKFNFEKLADVVKIIVINLNLIIDNNYYPTNESKFSNFKHRPIGIGIQGLADIFMKMNISFTSNEAKKLNRDIFEVIYFNALTQSNELASMNKPYDTFSGSPASKGILQYDMWNVKPEYYSDIKWETLKEDIKQYGLRNSLLVAPMPTASTAQIMGNNESFEPYTSNIYTRRVLSGEFILINKHLINFLKINNLMNDKIINSIILNKGSVKNIEDIPSEIREIYLTAWEISQKALLEMAADRGAYIDQSQSLNIFISSADPKIINSVHLYGYNLGLKTGSYYIRTKPILSTQNFSMDYNIEKQECLNCSS